MKLLLTLVSAYLFFASAAVAQLNMTFVGNLDYPVVVNDIWGYVTPQPHNTEYAIMGMFNGTAIISLADPANPVEVAFVPGPGSLWRDIKTWEHFAYVSNENSLGIAIIDLSELPNDSITYEYQTLSVPDVGVVNTAHNLWVDELGYLYVLGSNLHSGGVLIFDVFNDPANPAFVGKGLPEYSHDAYARGNWMYSADIYAGHFSVYDITDRSNPVMINMQNTDFLFTHNVWLSDDGNTLFTTDELANAPIGVFDVSDPLNIQRLAAFRPTATIGQGVIPHNAHVKDDFVIISHYTDGVVVFDGSRPHNPIEVGVYDTYPNPPGGFNGCWGAYPFLPSGLILGSDMNTGLYVLQPEYERACWLEGIITDAQSGLPIQGAAVEILETSGNTISNIEGNYYTGFANAGTYDVLVTKSGYYDFTTTVSLTNNVVTILDIELEPMAMPFTLHAQVINGLNGDKLENAEVILVSSTTVYETITDEEGLFVLPGFFEGTYTIYAAKWHFAEVMLQNVQFQVSEDVYTIELEPGYRDGFELDQGWTVITTANRGAWQRDIPVGVMFGDVLIAPDADVPNDYGNKAWVTGLGGDAGNQSVQNGYTRLLSPLMDLSQYSDPAITYHYWFYRSGPSGDASGQFKVTLTDGITAIDVLTTETITNGWSSRQVIRVSDYPQLQGELQLIVEANHALNTTGQFLLVEAGFDHFLVEEYSVVNTNDYLAENHIHLFPNPVSEMVQVYASNHVSGPVMLEIFDITGKRMYSNSADLDAPYEISTRHWPSGVYIIRMVDAQGHFNALRFVKL